MTLRAGYYDAGRPDYRGIIRADSYEWYRCYGHHHQSSREATACARATWADIKKTAETDINGTLPEGWEVIPR